MLGKIFSNGSRHKIHHSINDNWKYYVKRDTGGRILGKLAPVVPLVYTNKRGHLTAYIIRKPPIKRCKIYWDSTKLYLILKYFYNIYCKVEAPNSPVKFLRAIRWDNVLSFHLNSSLNSKKLFKALNIYMFMLCTKLFIRNNNNQLEYNRLLCI